MSLKATDLTIGGQYNWENQPERLVYLGKKGIWHQFAKTEDANNKVWCEVLKEHLYMMEETKNTGE